MATTCRKINQGKPPPSELAQEKTAQHAPLSLFWKNRAATDSFAPPPSADLGGAASNPLLQPRRFSNTNEDFVTARTQDCVDAVGPAALQG